MSADRLIKYWCQKSNSSFLDSLLDIIEASSTIKILSSELFKSIGKIYFKL